MKLLKLTGITMLAFCTAAPLQAFLINLFKPYDMMIRPYVDYATETVQTYATLEFGAGDARAWNSEGAVSSPLLIWTRGDCPSQNQRGLQMLEGFGVDSPITQLLTKIDANNNGTRGDLNITANLHLDVAGTGALRYFFLEQCAVSLYLPFYRYRLTDLCIKDLTPQEDPPSPEDYRTHTLLTDPAVFVPTVFELGCFEVDSWERTGIGDLSVFFDWQRDFPQAKTFLKSVMLAARIGVVAPSGKHTNQDLLFAFPFGYDKSWAIPFGFTLEALMADYVYAGFDIELTQIFGQSGKERIHTAHNQTDLVLLGKGNVYRDPGIEQQYSIYAGLKNLCGFNMRLVYQYRKHGHDTLSAFDNCINSAIANESIALFDSTLHMAILRVDYDFGVLMDNPCVAPQLELFARIPFNGKRAVGNTTIGFSLILDF
jgi:hypothetical protein